MIQAFTKPQVSDSAIMRSSEIEVAAIVAASVTIPIWIWGIIICVVATALTALGLVLQKYSHTVNAESKQPRPYYRQPWWVFGFSLFAVAQAINLASMSMAPQVMLSCLGATALVFNTLFAWLILGEDLHLFEVLAMLGMICSVCMVIGTTPVISANPKPDRILHDIIKPLFDMPFLSMTGCIVVVVLLLRLAAVRNAYWFPELDPLSWALCSSMSSGYTVNLFKATSEFIVAWHKTQPYRHWQCYATLFLAILFGVSQVHCLNKALNAGRAMMVVPTYFSLGLLAQLGISEVIVLDVPTTPLAGVIFGVGIFFILFFVVMLVRAKIAYEEQPDADIDEVNEKVFPITPSAWKCQEPSETTPLFRKIPSLPSRKLCISVPPSGNDDIEEGGDSPMGYSPLVRAASWSGYDPEAYPESFEDRERIYSVSLIGLGIA